MRWLMVGYMYLFLHRPFEIWPALGAFRLELLYALFAGTMWVMTPDKRWLPNGLHRAFLGFVVAVLVCWIASPWSASGGDVVYKYLTLLFFYMLLVTVVHDADTLRFLAQAFAIIMAVYMLHSVYEFRCGRHVHRMGITRLIGVDSTMNDPNMFGGNLLYALALWPALWVGNRSRRWRAFLLCYFVVTVGCVGLTGSRGSFLALVFWSTVTIARSRLRWVFAVGAVATAPVLWAALPPSLQTRFETIVNPDVGPLNAKVSAEGRLEGLMLGLDLFEQNPLTGCGPGVWRMATGSKLEAHNLYGQVLGEVGLLGALPFAFIVLFFWLNVRRVKRLYRAHPEWERDFLYHFAQGLGMALLLLLLNGNFAHNLFRYTWVWYGAFLIITRYCVERRALDEANAEATPAAPEDGPTRPAWDAAPA